MKDVHACTDKYYNYIIILVRWTFIWTVTLTQFSVDGVCESLKKKLVFLIVGYNNNNQGVVFTKSQTLNWS